MRICSSSLYKRHTVAQIWLLLCSVHIRSVCVKQKQTSPPPKRKTNRMHIILFSAWFEWNKFKLDEEGAFFALRVNFIQSAASLHIPRFPYAVRFAFFVPRRYLLHLFPFTFIFFVWSCFWLVKTNWLTTIQRVCKRVSEWVRRKNDLVWKREEFKKKPRTKFEKQLNAQDNTERDLCEMAFQHHKTKKK